MTESAITYEFSKYMVAFFLLMGMFYQNLRRTSWPFFIYLFLLVPGILFSAINLSYQANVANAIGFNLSGPICLGIAALYCYDRKLTSKRFLDLLNVLLYPIITMTVYLYLYTPSIKDVLTGTGSNFAASGGFGPNQVATILGLGCFVLFVRIIKIKDFKINLVDIILLGLIAYRGVVTFSRGGILTAGICIAIFCVFTLYYGSSKVRTSLLVKVAGFILTISVVWLFSSISTGGLIDKRYSNQDAAGRIKEDVTTGRAELLEKEMEAFYENPIFGIGVGKISEYRYEKTGERSATHNEVSRILSEHGLFGLLALGLLFFSPFVFNLTYKTNMLAFSFFAFWFLTINHSSMRIAAPAFVYGLIYLTIKSEKKTSVHRQ